MVALLVTATLVFSARYFDAIGNLFHALMLVFLAAMVGFSLTGDLFNMFVFFELMSGAAYALTAYKIEERGPLQGAINFAISNSVGAFTILIGIGLLYARTGALNLAQVGQALAGHDTDMLVIGALLLIMVGFLVKAAAVPFHFWLADAHAVAPVPVCVLFSGVMVELGLYAVARVYWTVFSSPLAPHAGQLRGILVALGVITAVVGAVMCFSQRHLKRLLAFSTVSHAGLFLVGIALLTPAALAGTTVYILGHGLTKGALFMAAGILLHRFAEVDVRQLRGRGREGALKVVGGVFFFGGLLLAGTPMLTTFFGKSMIETAALEHGYAWLPAVFVLTSALTAGAVLRAAGVIFCGWGDEAAPDRGTTSGEEERFETLQPHDRTPAIMVAPMLALMLGALAVGLVPDVVHGAEYAAAHFVDRSSYAAAVLHGGRVRFAPGKTTGLTASDFLYGAGSVIAAFALAAVSLFGRSLIERVPLPLRRGAGVSVAVLHRLHSGHVGDYVAWLTAGLGALGAVFALALR